MNGFSVEKSETQQYNIKMGIVVILRILLNTALLSTVCLLVSQQA